MIARDESLPMKEPKTPTDNVHHLCSDMLDFSSFGLCPTKRADAPYGDSIGFAMDVIVVQPSSLIEDERIDSKQSDSNQYHSSPSVEGSQYQRGVFASSDFVVHFPFTSSSSVATGGNCNYFVQIQINGNLLDKSFLSMTIPNDRKEVESKDLMMCKFLQGKSFKPPTKALGELFQRGLLVAGKNLIRFVLVQQGTASQRTFGFLRRAHSTNKVDDDQNDLRTPIAFAEAHLYLWSANDVVIISDIDGTVTKSDVRGVIDSIVMKSYNHVHDGICGFFSNLVYNCTNKSNSSKVRILYLSSRPLRFIASTRHYLENVSQSESTRKFLHASSPVENSFSDVTPDSEETLIGMPPGPIFLHQGSLRTVLVTELIKKSTYEFKADVLLRQVLLPFISAGKKPDSTLFIAGFGNKWTDALAYEMAGIEKTDIYIINPKSVLASTLPERFDSNDYEDKKRDTDLERRDDAMQNRCCVFELLGPTLSFKTGKETLSSQNLSTDIGEKRRTFQGYRDPQLTRLLLEKILKEK